ncbi:MAG: S9 family peptidase [Pseudomonadales bacterium]
MSKTSKPYGEWPSPITSELITSQAIGLGGAGFDGKDIIWLETRPQESGRSLLVRREPDGKETDLVPQPYNVRSRVHEYGGGAWTLHEGNIYFVNFADQQVYVIEAARGAPTQVTNQPDLRFADGCVDARRQRIIYVIEDHSAKGEPQNKLGAVDLKTGEVDCLAEGHDFYAAPTLHPNGKELAWIAWDHPNMPWDETLLYTAAIGKDGKPSEPITVVAGGPGVSIQQPRYNQAGELHYVSDESGWWNLYARGEQGNVNLCPRKAEFGLPAWGLGLATYQFMPDGSIVCIYGQGNDSRLALLKNGQLQDIALPFCDLGGISVAGDQLLFGAASPTSFPGIYQYDINKQALTLMKASADIDIDPSFISVAEAIEFTTSDQDTAHAFYYPPTNKDYAAPTDEAPPLLVILHGGPTGATHRSLSLRTQYWTSRGFALLDVNYRGSTGYGRAYRDKLKGGWGQVDVADTVAGAAYLVAQDKADAKRLAIRGGSAGGYTALAALAFTDTFTAGASHYGVADLEALATDTHKFEARYLDSLVGPYPETKTIYRERSPIHHVDQLSSPVIFFQGLEDKIVPPNQAEMMVAALAKKGLPVAYMPFKGEGHGFRQAQNIKRALDLELYFYGKIFGFAPADKINPIEITNLN